MTRGWERARRVAVEAAALALIGDKKASRDDRYAARAALAEPGVDFARLSNEQVSTLAALLRIARGLPLDGLVIRHVAERPTYHPCARCVANHGRLFVDVTWVGGDESMLSSITENLELIRKSREEIHATQEVEATEVGHVAQQLGDRGGEAAREDTEAAPFRVGPIIFGVE